MKSLKELRENIESTKELILNSDTEGLVQHINDSRIVYRENEYWLVDFKINNTIVIYVFQNGRVIISYDYISSDYIEDSMKLYDYIESLKTKIKNIYFDYTEDKKNALISDLLDLTGYEFNIRVELTNLISVNDGYIEFIYNSLTGCFFVKQLPFNGILVFDDGSVDSYDLFKRLDTYKETHKYIKELLENYIKEL